MLALKIAAWIYITFGSGLLGLGIWKLGLKWGCKWAGAQIVSTLAGLIGNISVVPLAIAAHAWEPVGSAFTPGRTVDAWTWSWMNAIWGNPEDGVSGGYAITWGDGLTTPLGKRGPYMPGRNAAWRAICWNWRNSADMLKYHYSEGADAPLAQGTLLGRTYKIGWQIENGANVLVFSL